MDTGFNSTTRTARTVAAMEWTLEWRQGHQLASVGLFALSSVYVAYQAASRSTAPEAWTAMLWLVYLSVDSRPSAASSTANGPRRAAISSGRSTHSA